MTDSKKSRGMRATATVIAHPTARMTELLASLGSKSLDEILATIDEFESKNWSIDGLSKALSESGWHPLPESVDGLAVYLATQQISNPESDESRAFLESEHGKQSLELFNRAAEAFNRVDTKTGGLWSAESLVEILNELCGSDNPIPVIQSYAHMYFDGADIRGRDPRPTLAAASPKAALLCKLTCDLRKISSKDLRPRMLEYWFSNPSSKRQTHRMTFRQLRKVGDYPEAYRTLVLDRLFANGYVSEMDPKLTKVSEWCWVLNQPMPAYLMVKAVSAVTAADDYFSVEDTDLKGTLAASIAGFCRKMESLQVSAFGGRSFLSEDDAYAHVDGRLRVWHPLKERPSIDFPSLFSSCLRDDQTDLVHWEECIDRAAALGHVDLAEALAAYALLHATLLKKGQMDWARMIAVIKRLRNDQRTGVLQTAIDTAHRTFLKVSDAPILAKRLENLVGRETPRKDSHQTAKITLIREVTSHPSKEEVRIRLIEHIGSEGWAKFSSDAQEWLVEADHNWSHWRFASASDQEARKDWGPIANQFSKAVEQALANRFKNACRVTGVCKPNDAPTLGNVVKLLASAANGEQPARQAVTDLIHRPIDTNFVDRLREFTNKHRNASSHPGPYPIDKADKLRLELFTHGLLRLIAEELL